MTFPFAPPSWVVGHLMLVNAALFAYVGRWDPAMLCVVGAIGWYEAAFRE